MQIKHSALLVFFLSISILLPSLAFSQSQRFKGEVTSYVFDYKDGTSEIKHRLTLDDGTELALKLPSQTSRSNSMLRTGNYLAVSGRLGLDGRLEVREVNQLQSNYRAMVGASAVTGTRSIALIIVEFATNANTCTADQLNQVMFGASESARTVYEESSRNQLTFNSDTNGDGSADIFGPFTISSDGGNCDNPGAWGQAAEDALNASGVSSSQYQHLVAVLPDVGCAWDGLAALGCGDNCTAFISYCGDYGVLAHELGHNFGMEHSTTDLTNSYNSTGSFSNEYGDLSCPMGSAFYYSMFNAPHQKQMGWLDPFSSSSRTITSSTSLNIAPLESDPSTASSPQYVRISASNNEYYYLSYRQKGSAYNLRQQWQNRLHIHRMPEASDPYTRYIGTGVEVGETFTDSSLGLTVCVNSQNTSAINVSVALNGDSCEIAEESENPGESDDPIPGDTDGDGVTDADETTAGTDPNDPGSYLETLSSPAYTLWNSFLGSLNILELVNPSTSESSTATVKLYDISGSLVYNTTRAIGPNGQVDIILNDQAGFLSDSYGVVKIEYSGDLSGRLSNYNIADDNTSYDFAFSVPLARPVRGDTALSFNTYQPSANASELGYQVLNWLSIVNLSQNTESFTIRSYNMQGELINTTSQTISSFQRVDLDGGHVILGPNVVGLHVITPDDANAPYIAQIIRYGTNANSGEAISNYLFAFPLVAHAGTGRSVSLPLSRQFDETNWLELINTSASSITIDLDFYLANGTSQSQSYTLSPYSQLHLNAGDYISSGQRGYVEVDSNLSNSLLAQSMFYFRKSDGGISAISGIASREPLGSSYLGSYNRFLGMNNWVSISNTTGSTVNLSMVANSTSTSGTSSLALGANSTTAFEISTDSSLATEANTYGTLTITPDISGSLVIDTFRILESGSEFDFAFPTETRPR